MCVLRRPAVQERLDLAGRGHRVRAGEPAGHDEAFDERTGPPRGTAVEAAAPQGSRTDETVLLLSAWLKRKLPLRRFLLGNVICTTCTSKFNGGSSGTIGNAGRGGNANRRRWTRTTNFK